MILEVSHNSQGLEHKGGLLAFASYVRGTHQFEIKHLKPRVCEHHTKQGTTDMSPIDVRKTFACLENPACSEPLSPFMDL
jgi:hypothetical protein